jgi:C-terminal processing protease CtpA/Prc
LIRRSTKNGIPVLTVESGHDEADLVPGDQLIAVDGVSVEDQDREVVVKLLAECLDSQVTLKVGQTACLFCDRITYFTFTCLSFLK